MGLKELFFGSSDDPRPRKVVKAEKKILNTYIQAADRQYFLHQLAQEGSPEAASALLKRFTVSCDNHTVDRDEKDLTSRLLVEMGTPAIEPIKDYLMKHDRGVNWPFRALKEMIEGEALVDFLVSILDAIGPVYIKDPERKEQMILTAKEYPEERVTRTLLPFLEDHDETIRYLTTEVLLSHGHEMAREPLLACLQEEESKRVIDRIALGFVTQGWQVDDAAAVAPKLPAGYRVADGKVVKG